MAPALPSILWWSSDMCDRRQHDDEFAPGLILEAGSLYFLATDQGWQVMNELPDDARRLVLEPPMTDDQHAAMADRLFLRQIAGTVDVRTRGEHWQREVLHRVGVLARVGSPPANLPATLASVDDVAKVCEAAGLPPTNPVGCYGDGSALVVAPTEAVWPLPVYRCAFPMRVIVSVHRNAPAATLWHAIQAARSTS